MKCFVIFRLDRMSSSLSHSVNQSQRIIVWFAMIPPLQTFSQLFWIHHQNKGPREMYNINQFESKLVCIVIGEHEFTQGFQSCLEWKSEKKTYFTTLIEAGAHQQPEKVKIHQFHPEGPTYHCWELALWSILDVVQIEIIATDLHHLQSIWRSFE